MMKKILIKAGLIIIVVQVLLISCEKDTIMFDASMNLVGFSSTSLVIREDASGVAKIYLGAATGTESTTITLSVDTVGLGKNAAKEGTDFEVSTKSVAVSVGETEVTINPVDNSVFTGDKKFYLVISSNSKNYLVSAQKRLLVTISDDEHPLKAWIGTYSVNAASYGDPGNWDESWTVITTPVEGDITKLSLTGIGGPSGEPVFAVLDKDALTISISKGQNIGDVYNWGDVEIYYGFDDLTLDQNIDLTGTINPNGSIDVDNWGHLIIDSSGDWVWDVFHTIWTKQK